MPEPRPAIPPSNMIAWYVALSFWNVGGSLSVMEPLTHQGDLKRRLSSAPVSSMAVTTACMNNGGLVGWMGGRLMDGR